MPELSEESERALRLLTATRQAAAAQLRAVLEDVRHAQSVNHARIPLQEALDALKAQQ